MIQENATEDIEGGNSSPAGQRTSAGAQEAQDDHEEEVSWKTSQLDRFWEWDLVLTVTGVWHWPWTQAQSWEALGPWWPRPCCS